MMGEQLYFGVKWPARAFENAEEVPTPVGQHCLLCKETVTEGESGVITAFVDGPSHRRRLSAAPQHIECFLRQVYGNVRHLEHRCKCYDPDAPPDAEDSRPYREQAREVMEWLVLHNR